MKKLLSKKMILTIAAGAMIAAVAIGGTFAWYTSITETKVANNFNTAIVDLETNKLIGDVLNFASVKDGDLVTLNAQKELEKNVNTIYEATYDPAYTIAWNAAKGLNKTDEEADKIAAKAGREAVKADTDTLDGLNREFSDWWIKYKTNISIKNEITGKVNLVKADVQLVTPGSVVNGDYSFKNLSNVPVYFRVKIAELDPESKNELLQVAYLVLKTKEGSDESVELTANDGYFYCPTPIYPKDYPVLGAELLSIQLSGYVLGEKNGNESQGSPDTYNFGTDGVELIQATNNAVYLADGWMDVVGVSGFNYVPVP